MCFNVPNFRFRMGYELEAHSRRALFHLLSQGIFCFVYVAGGELLKAVTRW